MMCMQTFPESMRDIRLDFERFFNLSPDLLCIAGYDGFFKQINPAVSRLLGYSEEELYARPINDFVFEDDKDATSVARKNLTESKALFHFENRYVTKAGEIVWLAWTSQPVEDDELVFAIAKNITHKKRLEAERLALLEDLTRLNNELKQFTLTTSHDLRSPLSSFMMAFELLDSSKVLDQETGQLMEMLKVTGQNVYATLTKYVEVLSEKNNHDALLEEIDLESTLRTVIRSIESLTTTSNTVIHTDFTEARKIKCTKPLLESIYLNLITNSIKYAVPDRDPVISVRSEKAYGVKRVIITDNGLGFDMALVKDRIFGMNQTFHNHNDSKGVGLYLVHSHITSLGGDICVESKVNEGTRFTLTFKD